MHRGRRETRRIARTKVILARLVRGGVCFSALRRKLRLRLLRAARDGSALVRAGERVRERPAILELAPQSTHLLAVERDHGGGDARRGGRDVVDASRRFEAADARDDAESFADPREGLPRALARAALALTGVLLMGLVSLFA